MGLASKLRCDTYRTQKKFITYNCIFSRKRNSLLNGAPHREGATVGAMGVRGKSFEVNLSLLVESDP